RLSLTRPPFPLCSQTARELVTRRAPILFSVCCSYLPLLFGEILLIHAERFDCRPRPRFRVFRVLVGFSQPYHFVCRVVGSKVFCLRRWHYRLQNLVVLNVPDIDDRVRVDAATPVYFVACFQVKLERVAVRRSDNDGDRAARPTSAFRETFGQLQSVQ